MFFRVLPVMNLIFCRRISRARRAETSLSTVGMGSRRSCPSTTVTSLPKARKMQAISQPMTPPPTMQRRLGRAVSSRASSLESTCSWSMPSPGISRTREPVAMITASPWTTVCAPSLARTRTSFALFTSAVPQSTSILSAWQVLASPPLSTAATLSLRACTAAMSTSAPWPLMPYSARRLARERASALARRVLVGMHPRLRQVPPRSWRSTSVTSQPFSAASNAAV